MSSPSRILQLSPGIQQNGVKGSFATTLPSKMVLNIDRRAVNAKPIANMDFILTIVKSLFVFFSFSSSASSFLFLLLSRFAASPCASFFFSSFLLCFSISDFNFWYFSVLYTRTHVTPSPSRAVQIEMKRMRRVSAHISKQERLSCRSESSNKSL